MVERIVRKEPVAKVITPNVVADRLHALCSGSGDVRGRRITVEIAPGLIRDIPSWTERSYRAVISNGEMATTILAAYEPADSNARQILTGTHGQFDWDYFKQKTPPTWARKALRRLGVEI